jgi:hypothetical protein
MTLVSTNEAIRRENCAEKNLNKEKKTAMILVVIQDLRIVLLSKKCKIL